MAEQETGYSSNSADGVFHFEPYRPVRADKLPPCRANCPSGTPVRDWIAEIAQAPRDEAGRHAAYARAWRLLVEHNPFPATMGRICPHPCEADCNRADKDGAVAINVLERFLGDWAIAANWPLPLAGGAAHDESIGVIGAGPAGLSFAYQMRRRGYPVTVYERHPQAGGMLRYGVPDYRLPPAVLDAELQRILALGVELRAPVRIGVDISLAELQRRHRVLFLGLGAQQARRLGLAGDDGEQVWNGIDYLDRYNRGLAPDLGEHLVVVGGGNTAIDVARAGRRAGARVTLVYRRRREDMPAIDEEVNAALEEGVEMRFLATPTTLIRADTGALCAVCVQRMRVVGSDDTGRSRIEPVAGDEEIVLASSLVSAVSQETDWQGLEALAPQRGFLEEGTGVAVLGESLVCAGGDLTGLDLASHAIGQGRRAAERIHAELRGLPLADSLAAPFTGVRVDHFPPGERLAVPEVPVAERLAEASRESCHTVSEELFLQEISRCFSCGLCNGCQLCWMYCGGQGFTRVTSPRPGHYFAFSTAECTGCGKCIELCPTGFLAQAGTR